MKSNTSSFELQLVVIGILIPVYLEILPLIIKPVWFFDMELPKYFSYLLGFLWFICLLAGTSSLIKGNGFLQGKSLSIYKFLFKYNCILTVTAILILLSAYVAVILTFLLYPLFPNYFLRPIIPIILLSFFCLVSLVIYLNYKNKRQNGGKNVKKQKKK